MAIATEWANDTTIHGWKHIVDGRNIVEKLIWFLLTLVAVVGAVYQGSIMIMQYLDDADGTQVTVLSAPSYKELSNMFIITYCPQFSFDLSGFPADSGASCGNGVSAPRKAKIGRVPINDLCAILRKAENLMRANWKMGNSSLLCEHSSRNLDNMDEFAAALKDEGFSSFDALLEAMSMPIRTPSNVKLVAKVHRIGKLCHVYKLDATNSTNEKAGNMQFYFLMDIPDITCDISHDISFYQGEFFPDESTLDITKGTGSEKLNIKIDQDNLFEIDGEDTAVISHLIQVKLTKIERRNSSRITCTDIGDKYRYPLSMLDNACLGPCLEKYRFKYGCRNSTIDTRSRFRDTDCDPASPYGMTDMNNLPTEINHCYDNCNRNIPCNDWRINTNSIENNNDETTVPSFSTVSTQVSNAMVTTTTNTNRQRPPVPNKGRMLMHEIIVVPDQIMVIREYKLLTWEQMMSNMGGNAGLFTGASILSLVHLVMFFMCGKCKKKDEVVTPEHPVKYW